MNQQFYKNLALWVVILVVMLLLFTTLKQNEAAPDKVDFVTLAYYLLGYTFMTIGAFAVISMAAKNASSGN